MDYDTMPRNMEEWNELVAYKVREAREAYEAEVAEAGTAEGIAPPQDKEYFEALFRAAGYYPQPVEKEPEPGLEELRARKLSELAARFNQACQTAAVPTPGGWEADANETAFRNVQGLLISMDRHDIAEVNFCGADNQFHRLTRDELEDLQEAIIAEGLALYQRKWDIREEILAAASKAELDSIRVDFSPVQAG